jgi:hypothetical protein
VPRPDRPALPPRELGARLDKILACAEKLVASLSVGVLERRAPEGDRQIRDLAFQVFRRGLAYVDGMDMGALPAAWLEETAPADLVDGPAIARYGALVRGRVSGWFEGAAASEYARTIEVFDGPQNGHDLLERMTVTVAQHLRRLCALAGELDLRPADPLLLSVFEGLPLPASPWQ